MKSFLGEVMMWRSSYLIIFVLVWKKYGGRGKQLEGSNVISSGEKNEAEDLETGMLFFCFVFVTSLLELSNV